MFELIHPATADLLFTVMTTLGLLVAGTVTLLALPWTDEEIAATERAALQLVNTPAPPRTQAARS